MKYLEIKCRNWSAATQKCVCLSSLPWWHVLFLSIINQAFFYWLKPHQHRSWRFQRSITSLCKSPSWLFFFSCCCCPVFVWSEKNEKQSNWLAKHYLESFILVAVAISSFILGGERNTLCVQLETLPTSPLKYTSSDYFSRAQQNSKVCNV